MPDIGAIEPVALKARLDRGDRIFILDVREPFEISIAPFPGASHIPMGDIPSRLTELDPDRETVVVCHHGVRSAQVAMYLARHGFRACAQSVRRNRRVVGGRRSVNSALLTGCSSRNNAEWKSRDDLSRSRNPDERRARQGRRTSNAPNASSASAAARGANLVALPEVFNWRGKRNEQAAAAETLDGAIAHADVAAGARAANPHRRRIDHRTGPTASRDATTRRRCSAPTARASPCIARFICSTSICPAA